jgi:hypothetical protein
VVSIGASAFYCCTSLTGVLIPDSVVSIGASAFYYCTSLTGVLIPDSVTSIGKSAFSNCTSLVEVIIPNSVTSIENSLFYNCEKITRVVMPDSVTSIGSSVFYKCYKLTEVMIPDSVITISETAFERTIASIFIPLNNDNLNYKQSIIDNLPKSQTIIDVSYNIDISGTWLEEDTTLNVKRPIIKDISDNIEKDFDILNKVSAISLKLEVPYNESNIEITKFNGDNILPTINEEGEYIINETEIYSIKIKTDAGAITELSVNAIIDPEKSSNLLDVYIESENMLQISLNSSCVTFEDFVFDSSSYKSNAIELKISSSLPYIIKSTVVGDISNPDKTETIDVSILNIKESTKDDSNWNTFSSTNRTVLVYESSNPVNDKIHYFDLKLDATKLSQSIVADIYKTVIKMEVEQV